VTKELTPEEVEGLFRLELGKRRLPFLWIVDDFPVHASSDELRSWLAPHPLGRSLITTRSQEYTALARPVELGALPPQDGLDLLTVAREPGDEGELVAAREIVQELGGHALAVDVAGAALGTAREWTSFEAFRRLLLDQTADALDLAAEFAGELPSGHERSIAATIGASIQRLSKRGRDVAALASQLAAAPVPLELVEAALALVDRLEGPNAESRARAGADELRQQSLAERVGESLQAFQYIRLSPVPSGSARAAPTDRGSCAQRRLRRSGQRSPTSSLGTNAHGASHGSFTPAHSAKQPRSKTCWNC
jgi:hypothetical protein